MTNNSEVGTSVPRILVTEDVIRERLRVLAARINDDYRQNELVMVCLTNSAMVFATDLMRLINVPVKMHAMAFVSYTPAPKCGEVRVTLDVAEPLEGQHVLVVEGMVISGRTPLYLMNILRQRQPASLELCAIGIKPSELTTALSVKYSLFEFGKEWVAGYGIGHGPEKASRNLLDMSPSAKKI